MNVTCPNKNLPEWKELVSVLGENQAYYLWDQNNGYGLDKAPNEQPSKLFSDLLSHFQGDRNRAIQAKAKVYSEAFKNWFGDWLSDDKTDVSKVVDENGEPLLTYHTGARDITIFLNEESITISRDEKWITGKDINDYIKDGYSASEEQIEAYNKGQMVTLTKPNAIYTTDSIIMSSSYRPTEFDMWEKEEQNMINNAEEYTALYYGEQEGVQDDMYDFIVLSKDEFFSKKVITTRRVPDDYDGDIFNVPKEMLVVTDNREEVTQLYNKLNQYITQNYPDGVSYDDRYKISQEYAEYEMKQRYPDGNPYFQHQYEYDPNTILGGQYPLLCSLKNPLIVDAKDHNWNDIEFNGGTYTTRELEQYGRDNGYDGVIINNVYDYGQFRDSYAPMESNTVIIQYDSNQIKSVDNQGTFSIQNNDIRYRFEYVDYEKYQDNRAALLEIGNFTDSQQLINYLLASDQVGKRIKSLLRRLSLNKTKLVIEPVAPGNTIAKYQNGVITLYANRIAKSSLQTTAEDLAHELLHHYLMNEYYSNKQFKQKLDELQKKYRKYWDGEEKPYGLKEENQSDEFLNEFMASSELRMELKTRSLNLFERLKQYILYVFNKLLGRENKVVGFNRDLADLQTEVLRLIDDVNQSGIDSNFNVNRVFERQDTSQINKTYDKIQKGLKSRLNAVKRYANKNPQTWNRLQTVIQQLQNSEAEQGILQFIDHVNDTIGDSIRFLNRPFDEINSKQVRQLSQDYVGFYKPLLDEINYLVDTTDIFKELPDYNDIRQQITTLSNQMNTVNNRFRNIARAKGIQEVTEFLVEQGMPQEDIDELIDYLNSPTTDTNFIINWIGMSSNSSNAVIRSIAKILNDTKNQQQRDVFEVGTKLVDLLNKAVDKYGVDVQKLLYEKLNDGTYSGFRVKPLNDGQYKKDCNDYIQSLAERLGISKDKEGMYELPDDEDIQKKWFDALNKFYNKRAVRRYKAEYYTLRNNTLSMKTRDAINEIQTAIDSITSPITIDGIEHTELLTESENNQLTLLRRQKQLLANPYNLDGSVKTGVDAQIAKELTDFYNIVNKRVKYQADWDRYYRDLAKIERQYKDQPEKVELWKKRNTRLQYSQEFYDRLDRIQKKPQSPLYKELLEKRRQFKRLFANPDTGLIDVASLSDSERRSLLQLDQQIADAYNGAPSTTIDGSEKFSDIAEVVPTEQYYQDAKAAKDAGVYNEWFNNNHYEDYRGRMHPASYYTQLIPADGSMPEMVPTGKYTQLDPSSDWYDDRYDPNGPSIQPSKEFYDNSKAYNAMASKPEVKALYDEIERVMEQSNSYISFLTHSNDARMPQVPARLMQIFARQSKITDKFGFLLNEFIETQPDDLDYVDDFATMPNGDPIRVIPTRFIKMLDDPNTISTDAVSSVIAYYSMADNYRLMSQKQDTVELMLNLLKNLTISSKNGIKNPGDSNSYKQAQLLVDRLMYGKNKQPIKKTILGKEINISKALDIIRNFITKVNLSGNLWTIATSFFTDATYTTIESTLGRYFSSNDLHFAIQEFSRQLPTMMKNIGQPNPKGKLPYLFRLNQVVKDNQEVYDRLDQSRVLRSINQNFWYAGYTQSDYTVKGHTILSIYHSYRFVNGVGFMSEQQYINRFYPNDFRQGKVAFKQLDTTLYDAYIESDNGDVTVNNKYKEYITERLLNDVKNKIEIFTRRIDGTLRDVDKAQIHTNSITSYLVMHKNFMISGLHDRFKKRQFNLDLHTMEEGYYRVISRFLSSLIKNRHFALTQLLADYNELQDYEQYAIRRVMYELTLIAASSIVAISIANLVDGDDDYDTWLTQSITYIAMRSAFEFRTLYNPIEFMSLIKSPTAAFTTFENASHLINLFNPMSYMGDRTPFTIIDRGSYKGMPIILRNMIKVTPFRSIFEAGDPEAKRNYLQNQLMNF